MYQAKGRSYLKQVEAIIKVASNVAEIEDIQMFEARMNERGRGTFSQLCEIWIEIYRDCFEGHAWAEIGAKRLSKAYMRTCVKKGRLYPGDKPLLPEDDLPGNRKAENRETYKVAREALENTKRNMDTMPENELARFREMCNLQKENEDAGDPFAGHGYGGSSGNLSELYRGSSASLSEFGVNRGSSASLSEMGGSRLRGSASGGSLAGYGMVESPFKSSRGSPSAGSPFGRSSSGGSPLASRAPVASIQAAGSSKGSARALTGAAAYEGGQAGEVSGRGPAKGSPRKGPSRGSPTGSSSSGGSARQLLRAEAAGQASTTQERAPAVERASQIHEFQPLGVGLPSTSQEAGPAMQRSTRVDRQQQTAAEQPPALPDSKPAEERSTRLDQSQYTAPGPSLMTQESERAVQRATRVDQRQPTAAAATPAQGERQGAGGSRGGASERNPGRGSNKSKFCCSARSRVKE